MHESDESPADAVDKDDTEETSPPATTEAADPAEPDGHAAPNDVPTDVRDQEETPAQATGPTDEEDLPEWEPLTPELVEDEAIRGDFMLRWAAILLALLMGWTIIQDTSVLTHIKSGQYLAQNGWLPPATDVFSSSATDRRWVNLSWLWDLTLAGVFGVAGAWGISLLKALLSAGTFWLLLRISLPDMPTWWGSVCAVLALIAAFPSLRATPACVTLLGMACLLWLLHQWTLDPQKTRLWPIPGLLWLWCQFDDRAWMGAAALLSFTFGHWLDEVRNRKHETAAAIKPLAIVTGCSIAAMLAHPFVWETLLSPIRLYQWEYPSLRLYANPDVAYLFERYPLWSREFWENVHYFNTAGLLLWLVALVTLVLNRDRLRCSHLGVFIALTALACAGGREIAVAGIANAVLATVNAQQWYRASFRQTYSVDTGELLFSRGGRAMTVVTFFLLGFAMVSGHLTGAGGRRVGMGIDPQLKQMIASYESVLEDSFDDRPFNFRPFQGDLLIWIGQRPFIDTRVRLFAAGEPSLVDEHVALRPALRQARDESSIAENRILWRKEFDKYGITHVLPRLSGANPDYNTVRDLSLSSDWTLTRLGAATATYYRSDSQDAELNDYVAARASSNLVEHLLRHREDSPAALPQRLTWPQPPTVYERYLYLPKPTISNALQLARHYLVLFQSGAIEPTIANAVAAAYGALRQSHAGLAENPNSPSAYHILAQAYGALWQIEQSLISDSGVSPADSLRATQVITAYHHALLCDPQNAEANYQLFQIFGGQQKRDLALRHLQQFQNITGKLTPLSEMDLRFAEEQQHAGDLLTDLTAELTEVRQQRDDDLAAGADRLLLVESLAHSGYTLTALETLEQDLTVMSGKPETTLMYGQLLLDAGRTAEAYDQLRGLKALADQGVVMDWSTMAAFGQIVAEDLTGALATMREEQDRLARSAPALLLPFGPLKASGPIGPADDGFQSDPLAAVSRQTRAASVYFDGLLPRWEGNELRQALVHLELAQNQAAASLFQRLLERDPATGLRPIAELYLSLLTDGTQIPPLPEGDDASGVVPDLFGDASLGETPDDALNTESRTVENVTEPRTPRQGPPAPELPTPSGSIP